MTLQSLPNTLSFARLILSLPAGWLICNGYIALAAVVVVIALFTDMADGWIARKYLCQTQFGSILDPLADKIFAFSLFFSLAYTQKISFWIFALVFARESAIIIGFIILWANKKPILPTHWMSRLNTALQGIVLVCILLSWPFKVPLVMMIVTSTLSLIIYGRLWWKSFRK